MRPKFQCIDINSWHAFMDESGTKDYKRLIKLKNLNQWPIYLPDTNPQNPNYFSLICILINGFDLINKFIPSIKKIKYQLYNDENIVLHLSDMISAKNSFSKYLNNPELFKNDLEKIVKSIEDITFYIFIIHIDKVKMLNTYIKPAVPYEFGPTLIMERIGKFFKNKMSNYEKRIILRVWFESRKKENDLELKKYMIDELKLPEKELIEKTNFPRFPESIKNTRLIEWHIHGLPKKPEDLIKNEYYKNKYSYEVGKNLIHGLHIADLLVSAQRRYVESQKYSKIKYLEVEPIIEFINRKNKLNMVLEIFFP